MDGHEQSTFKIAALAGDGIGPEIMREAIKVLRAVEAKHALSLEITEAAVGWDAIDKEARPCLTAPWRPARRRTPSCWARSDCTIATRTAQGKATGASGLPAPAREFGLFANLRPIKTHPALAFASPLRPERQGMGSTCSWCGNRPRPLPCLPKKTEEVFDARERGGTGRARHGGRVDTNGDHGFRGGTDRARGLPVGLAAPETGDERGQGEHSRDEASCGVKWSPASAAVSEVVLEHMWWIQPPCNWSCGPPSSTSSSVKHLRRDPRRRGRRVGRFVGMLPSASLGATHHGRTFGLYDPPGVRPGHRGKNRANPIAQILAAALMLALQPP